MALRTRLTLLAAGAVGITVVLASVVCYLVMRGELRAQVDAALGRQGGLVVRAAPVVTELRDRFELRVPAPPPRAGGSAPYVQVLGPDGQVVHRDDPDVPAIRVTARDRAVAAGTAKGYVADRTVAGATCG